ncbi:hypothetical protein FA95DRAFT_1680528 [Auriscalpium vulgare]|uniref:Uncharacterized protein n=1 Tax=Auriscalpium vulgare TaxID=40419 RepID=A0ACB8RMM2_9AGAM|nr:hypothetical protein FA95DRAFT_1680528 [Auriscalpium vulgare]
MTSSRKPVLRAHLPPATKPQTRSSTRIQKTAAGALTVTPAVVQNITELQELCLSGADAAYMELLKFGKAPKLRIIEIRQDVGQGQTFDFTDDFFHGTVPGPLMEHPTSPFLRTRLVFLEKLILDHCGVVWASQDEMLTTLALMPNLSELTLTNAIPAVAPRPPNVLYLNIRRLTQLALAGPSRTIVTALSRLELPLRLEVFEVKLKCDDSAFPYADIITLGHILRRFTNRPGGGAYRSAIVTVGPPEDDWRTGFLTDFAYHDRKNAATGNLPRESKLSFTTPALLKREDLLFLFANLFSKDLIHTIDFDHQMFLPEFPWIDFLEILPALTDLGILTDAPYSLSFQARNQFARFQDLLSRLSAMTVKDCELVANTGPDGRGDGVEVVQTLRSAVFGRNNSRQLATERRDVLVPRIRLNDWLKRN